MKSRTTRRFRKAFAKLPSEIQQQAREAYRRFQEDPNHPGLRFKKVHPRKRIYSVRISTQYRALGVREGEEIVWFWIGSHDDYSELLKGR